jgi:putative membrane protein
MQSEGASEETRTRRLHPTSLLFTIGKQAKSLLLPGIIVFVVARGGGRELLFMLLFIPAVVVALFHYWSYRYRFDPEELVIREGIVFRNERHVPYTRIQNIDLVQNPLHRLFRVAEVRLETAGGEKPEAVMRVLSLDAVRQMRAHVFTEDRNRHAATATAEDGAGDRSSVLHSMGGKDVFLFGLISNKGMVVVSAAMGVAWQLDVFDKWESFVSPELVQQVKSLIPRGSIAGAALYGLLAIVALIVLMRVLSVVWAVLKFHGFRLTRSGDDLRAEYGLLSRVTKTIPRRRIQVLSTRQGFLHRRCGRVAVQVETAGSAGEEQGGSGRLWLAPLVRQERLAELVRSVLPEVDLAATSWQPVSPRARRRLIRVTLYVSAVLTVPAVWGLGVWGLAVPLALVPLGCINSALTVSHTAYALTAEAVFFRSGWWTRRISVARFGKIQSLRRGESPFDRRHRMASVGVDTAGATRIGHAIEIPYLEADVATGLMGRLYDEAGRTAFHW